MFAFLFAQSLLRYVKVARLALIQREFLTLASNNPFLQAFFAMIRDHFDLSCSRRTVYLTIMLTNRLN